MDTVAEAYVGTLIYRMFLKNERIERRKKEVQMQVERMKRNGVRKEEAWYEFQRWREGRDELRRGITTHAFNMVDFIFAAKDFQKRLYLEESIFYYPNTKVEVFYKNKNPRKKVKVTKKILLNGFHGASWFDFQIQLTRFLQKDSQVIDITISHYDSSLVVVFLPRVFTPKKRKGHQCQLLTVDTKTGESTCGFTTFQPSIYNPRIEGPNDDEYLF